MYRKIRRKLPKISGAISCPDPSLVFAPPVHLLVPEGRLLPSGKDVDFADRAFRILPELPRAVEPLVEAADPSVGRCYSAPAAFSRFLLESVFAVPGCCASRSCRSSFGDFQLFSPRGGTARLQAGSTLFFPFPITSSVPRSPRNVFCVAGRPRSKGPRPKDAEKLFFQFQSPIRYPELVAARGTAATSQSDSPDSPFATPTPTPNPSAAIHGATRDC